MAVWRKRNSIIIPVCEKLSERNTHLLTCIFCVPESCHVLVYGSDQVGWHVQVHLVAVCLLPWWNIPECLQMRLEVKLFQPHALTLPLNSQKFKTVWFHGYRTLIDEFIHFMAFNSPEFSLSSHHYRFVVVSTVKWPLTLTFSHVFPH